MKILGLLAVLSLLCACSSEDKTPAEQLEAAGREQGQQMAAELNKPIDKAKAIEEQLQEAAQQQQEDVNAQTEMEPEESAEEQTEAPALNDE